MNKERLHRLAIGLSVALVMHALALLALSPAAASPAGASSAPVTVRMIPVGLAVVPAVPPESIDAAAREKGPTVALAEAQAVQSEGSTVQANASDSGYLTASLLSRRPTALEVVDIPYPDSTESGTGAASVVLVLFINEQGTVDRIEVEGSDVPAPFAEAAKNAFSRATFDPGRLMDQPVKSQVRIEVSFNDDR